MKRFFTFNFLNLVVCISLFGQTPSLSWAKQFSGPTTDRGYSIAVDNTGNIYSTGAFTETTDFNPADDPNTGVFNLTAVGNYDIYISKLDPNGKFLWAKGFGGNDNGYKFLADYGYSIKLDSKGNVYTTGYFQGTADFDPSNGVYNLTSNGQEDIFIVKLDSLGNFIWAKQVGGNSHDFGYSLSINSIDNITITGSFRNTVDFNPGSGTFNLTANGINKNLYVLNLDKDGNFLWAKSFGGSDDVVANSITSDSNGNIYITGFSTDTAFFGADKYFHTNGSSSELTFILKLDSNGSLLWSKGFTNVFPRGDIIGNSISVDLSSNIYFTGNFSGSIDFNPNPNGVFKLSANSSDDDIFMAKYTSNGEFIWAKQMGGIWDDKGSSIFVENQDNIYLTGVFYSEGEFDPNTKGKHVLTSHGKNDIFIAKYTKAGEYVYAGNLGGSDNDSGNGVVVDKDHSIYITGGFFFTADMDPGPGSLNLTAYYDNNNTYEDAYIEKLCVIDTPTITVIPSSPCQGDTVTLTASQAFSYKWSDGSTGKSIKITKPGNYSVTVTNNIGCSSASNSLTIIFSPINTITLNTGNNNQTLCVGTAIKDILFSSSGATGANYSGLPNGVNGIFSSNKITISGTPTKPGIYNYIINLTGGCGNITAIGTITVLDNNAITLLTGNKDQTVCVGTAIKDILFSSSGATGVNYSGFPDGVTGIFSSNKITISGTPTNPGTYNYTINLSGGCGNIAATGTITVLDNNTITLITGNKDQTACVGTAIKDILFSSSGATGVNYSGFPDGVTGIFSSNKITISGTPTNPGTYNYTINLSGGCGNITATGTITVLDNNTITLITDNKDQTVCVGTAIKDILFDYSGATGANYSGLPDGVTGIFSSNKITISGTPTKPGTYSYTISLSGGCGNIIQSGIIICNPLPNVDLGPDITLQNGTNDTILNPFISGNIKSFKWSTGDTSKLFIRVGEGLYFLSVVNEFNCSSTDTILIKLPTNENDYNFIQQIKVFPNPVRNILYIDNITQSIKYLELINSIGNTIYSLNVSNNTSNILSLNMEQFVEGIYFLKTTQKNKLYCFTIIKI